MESGASRLIRSCLLLACLAWLPPVVAGAGAQGGTLLVGGGSHDDDCDLADGHWSDAVYGWLVDRSLAGGPSGGNGRILVLDIEPDDGCDDFMPGSNVGVCAFFECLGSARGAAVEADHLCARSGTAGCVEPAAAASSIAAYDAVWLRGGDQSIYVDAWAGTAVEQALYGLWSAGGTLAGTSAGAMVQSEISSTGTAPSWQATSDPYHPDVELTRTFLHGAQAVLPGTLVDTHFTIRARLGRLASFVALLAQDGLAENASLDVLGLGIDQETGLAVLGGVGEVLGEGAVTVLHASGETSQALEVGEPPRVGPLVYRSLTEGFRFDLPSRQIVSVPAAAATVDNLSLQTQFTPVTVEGHADADQAAGAWLAEDLTDASAFYEGRLTALAGGASIPAAAVMTRLENVTAERENRAGAPLWLFEEYRAAGLALFTDAFAGASCNAVEARDDETLRALPGRGCPDEQSVVLLDCSELGLVARSPWDGDGNGLSRHTVALDLCHLSLLSSASAPYTPRRLAGRLFADGFESGAASAWSAASPSP